MDYIKANHLYISAFYISASWISKKRQKTLMTFLFLFSYRLFPLFSSITFIFFWIWRLSLIDLSHTPVPRCVLYFRFFSLYIVIIIIIGT